MFEVMNVNYNSPSYFIVVDKYTMKEVSRFQGGFLLNLHTVNAFDYNNTLTIMVVFSIECLTLRKIPKAYVSVG